MGKVYVNDFINKIFCLQSGEWLIREIDFVLMWLDSTWTVNPS